MVLQRNKPISIWGWADRGEKISAQFNKQTKTVKADKSGKWMLKLAPEKEGGPFQLTIKGKNTITFSDVLAGEVWICSGQSNMEMPIEGWGKINNYEQEIATANYPEIRHIKIPNTINAIPQKDIPNGEWKICSPATAGDFTAAGYFFARELYNQLKVPIGLINTSWGGTHIETWTSREAFENSDEFKSMIVQMPLLNLDSLSQARKEATMKRIGYATNTGEAETWKNATFDDSKWQQMQLPGLWEEKQLGDFDGVVWFRKTIDTPAGDAGKEATLELAMIDDNDVTYVNGVKVGATNSYNANRKYQIPAGILKEGKNVIAVRVEDTGGGGGIYGESTNIKITIGKDVISLAGDWNFSIEASDENVIATIHLMNENGLEQNAAKDQSSRSANDNGIDAWYYNEKSRELFLYQSKLSESKALALGGLNDLLRGSDWVEKIIIDGSLEKIPVDNHMLYGLYTKLSQVKESLIKIVFVLLSLYEENELEDDSAVVNFNEKMIKSRLNEYVSEVLDGKIQLKIQQYCLDTRIPNKISNMRYLLFKILGYSYVLNHSYN